MMNLLAQVHSQLPQREAVLLLQAVSAVWSFGDLRDFHFDIEPGQFKHSRSVFKKNQETITKQPTQVSPESKRSMSAIILFFIFSNKIFFLNFLKGFSKDILCQIEAFLECNSTPSSKGNKLRRFARKSSICEELVSQLNYSMSTIPCNSRTHTCITPITHHNVSPTITSMIGSDPDHRISFEFFSFFFISLSF